MNSSPFIKLEEYPNAIASLQQEIVKIDALLDTSQFEHSAIVQKIDRTIAFDDRYKNDNQRKVARLDLLANDPDYIRITEEIRKFQEKRKLLEIHLEKRKNEFSILKLNERRRLLELQQSFNE